MKSSPIGAALEQIELERANLTARLAKVDALIAQMRDVFHLPEARRVNGHAAKAKGHRPAPRVVSSDGQVTAETISEALRDGPLSPADLAKRLDVPRANLQRLLAVMTSQRLIVATGVTQSRRYTLPGKPAKEAP